MRAVSFKRPAIILVGIGLVACVSVFLMNGYEPPAVGEKLDTPRLVKGFSDLEASISNLNNVLKSFEKKQDVIQKMLEEDQERHKKAEQEAVKKQPEAQIQEKQEAPAEKKTNKLFPHSPLFKEWGENLSEDDQREAEALFQKYGYNVFLSDRLPLDRVLPDTRDKRCLKKTYPHDLPSLGVVLIYLDEALSILKRALRSILDRTPKRLLKEIIMVDDNSSNGWFVMRR